MFITLKAFIVVHSIQYEQIWLRCDPSRTFEKDLKIRKIFESYMKIRTNLIRTFSEFLDPTRFRMDSRNGSQIST